MERKKIKSIIFLLFLQFVILFYYQVKFSVDEASFVIGMNIGFILGIYLIVDLWRNQHHK